MLVSETEHDVSMKALDLRTTLITTYSKRIVPQNPYYKRISSSNYLKYPNYDKNRSRHGTCKKSIGCGASALFTYKYDHSNSFSS